MSEADVSSSIRSSPAAGQGASSVVPWRVLSVVAVAYATGSLLAFQFFHARAFGAVLFVSAGVSFAALVHADDGARNDPTIDMWHRFASSRSDRTLRGSAVLYRWAWVLVAIAVAELTVDLAEGQSLRAAFGFVLANTAEPLVGAGLYCRYFGGVALSERRGLLGFLVCGVLAGPFVGGLIGATTISLVFHQRWIGAFFPFWLGDGLGVLTVGGVILAVLARRSADVDRRAAPIVMAVTITAVATVVGFWPSEVPLVYLPMPLLFWFAFRRDLATVAMAGVAMAITANVMSAGGRGPWGKVGPTERLGIATLQAFLGVALVSAWLLAVEIAETKRARTVADTMTTQRSHAQALQAIAAGLAIAATPAEVCKVIIEAGIPLIADQGVVAAVTAAGDELQTWTTAGFPTEVSLTFHRLPLDADTQITHVARNGRVDTALTIEEIGQRFPETLATYVAAGINSCVCIPARHGTDVRGALAFGFAEEGPIASATLDLANALADLTGRALARASDHERFYDEAHALQRALLPVIGPTVDGVEVWTRYRAADLDHDVGGDWFDVFSLPGGRTAFAFGDVVGHDLAAAVAMSRLQSAIRTLAVRASGPADLLQQLDISSTQIPNASLATIGYGDFDATTGRLRYACAGHLPFLLVTADRGGYLWDGRSTPMDAMSPENNRAEAELLITSQSWLVGFTDGLIERRGETIDVGLERLRQLATSLPTTRDVADWCDSTIASLIGDHAQDDAVVMCLRLQRQ